MNQMATASAADVCDILEMFAAAYWHPSGPVLHAIEAKLDNNCSHLPIVSLCTSLWSFAIFAHVPNISFQRTYANRIETDIAQLNAFQLCSVLWVFALFRSCTMGVWNTLVGKLRTFNVSEIDESALKYFFQVCLCRPFPAACPPVLVAGGSPARATVTCAMPTPPCSGVPFHPCQCKLRKLGSLPYAPFAAPRSRSSLAADEKGRI